MISISSAEKTLMHFRRMLNICLFASAFVLAALPAQAAEEYEQRMLSSIKDIQAAQIDSSLDSLKKVVEEYPNSKVGHLLLADMLSIRSGARNPQTPLGSDPRFTGLREEIKRRWDHSVVGNPAEQGLLPANLVQSSPNSEHAILVDASQARLYVYRNTGSSHQLVDSFYMTVGKLGMGKRKEGDLRTPVGVYHVTSYLPGEGLPDRYGPGAFPINYPNVYDLMNNRTGYGIWIHGTESNNYNRVPWASDGCVTLSNTGFLETSQYIKTNGTTPVIIAESYEWQEPGEIENLNRMYRDILDNWVSDWESLDHERYQAHYSSRQFSDGKIGRDQFLDRKRRIIGAQDFIDVEIEDLSIYAYPGDREMVQMSFLQKYRSSHFRGDTRKTMIWERSELDRNQWKIIYEG